MEHYYKSTFASGSDSIYQHTITYRLQQQTHCSPLFGKERHEIGRFFFIFWIEPTDLKKLVLVRKIKSPIAGALLIIG
ncbi:hypothetical protein, partial [Ammoniphilus sp. 3BR4]|uniref:hypothetical protein n=1 Tax=Ammoniphilus sp. 3BR4 TaxID=3158265 RepID=UPI003466E9AB